MAAKCIAMTTRRRPSRSPFWRPKERLYIRDFFYWEKALRFLFVLSLEVTTLGGSKTIPILNKQSINEDRQDFLVNINLILYAGFFNSVTSFVRRGTNQLSYGFYLKRKVQRSYLYVENITYQRFQYYSQFLDYQQDLDQIFFLSISNLFCGNGPILLHFQFWHFEEWCFQKCHFRIFIEMTFNLCK